MRGCVDTAVSFKRKHLADALLYMKYFCQVFCNSDVAGRWP